MPKNRGAKKLSVAFTGQIEYDKLSKEWKQHFLQGAVQI
jgi:hypothetical protein